VLYTICYRYIRIFNVVLQKYKIQYNGQYKFVSVIKNNPLDIDTHHLLQYTKYSTCLALIIINNFYNSYNNILNRVTSPKLNNIFLVIISL